MHTVCEINQCIACQNCIESCHAGCISLVIDTFGEFSNAIIDKNLCTNCGLCKVFCSQHQNVKLYAVQQCVIAHANDNEVRKSTASGGIATLLSKVFVSQGGYVCGAIFDRNLQAVRHIITNQDSGIDGMKGSKYVKSEMAGISLEIKSILNNGHRLLFIGTPCQVASIRILFGNNPNIYYVDLVCHGTPFSVLLDRYFSCNKINNVNTLHFRSKHSFGLYVNGSKVTPQNIFDTYMIAFLEGLDYAEACYSCKYATQNRIGDITLGDYYGKNISESLFKEGISLVTVNTEMGKQLFELLENSITQHAVDFEDAVDTNPCLSAPTRSHPNRNQFFRALNNNATFDKAVSKSLWWSVAKQKIKCFLLQLKRR